MTQIKTYRVEYEKVGTMHRVRIFGRMGEIVKSELPEERILRDALSGLQILANSIYCVEIQA